MKWVRHTITQNLVASGDRGLYTISKGGQHRREYVLRFARIPRRSASAGIVLGIHRREPEAKDEAEKHNTGDYENG